MTTTESGDAKYQCDNCNGSGKEPIPEGMSHSTVWMGSCQKCKGTGWLDWIDNVMGKKETTGLYTFDGSITASEWVTAIDNSYITPASATVDYVDNMQSTLKTYIDEEIKKRVKEEVDKLLKDK